MIGLDTTMLVEAEVADSPRNAAATAFIRKSIEEADSRLVFALAPQVLTEFIHVVTDSKRFVRPLTMEAAIDRAEFWWSSREVERVHPGREAAVQFFRWMRKHRLGRKRILDTYLAATYAAAGIRLIASGNGRDFTIFDGIQTIEP
jgi:predicted nucleic acid-binding protein